MVEVHTLSELRGRGRRGRGPGRGAAARGRGSADAVAAPSARGRGRGRARARGSSDGPFSGAGNSLKVAGSAQDEHDANAGFDSSASTVVDAEGGQGQRDNEVSSSTGTGVFQRRGGAGGRAAFLQRMQEENDCLAAAAEADRRKEEAAAAAEAERRRLEKEQTEEAARARATAAEGDARDKARRQAYAASGRSGESLLQRLLKGPACSAPADKATSPAAAAAAADEVIVISDSDDDDEPANQPPAQSKGTERRPGVGSADAAAAPPAGVAAHGVPASTAAASATAEQGIAPDVAEVRKRRRQQWEQQQEPQQQQQQARRQADAPQQRRSDRRAAASLPDVAFDGDAEQQWESYSREMLDSPPPMPKAAAPKAKPPAQRQPAGCSNPFMDPPRYMPPGGEEAQVDLSLRTNEVAEVTDVGGTWHRARAVLDTGNGGCTMITFPMASQLGLVDSAGRPIGVSRPRFISVHGVVAGATEKIPLLSIRYRIKGKYFCHKLNMRHVGKEICCVAGVTQARLGCELLLSRREIADFEADGYRFTARY